MHMQNNANGSTGIRTQVAGFKVLSANQLHYRTIFSAEKIDIIYHINVNIIYRHLSRIDNPNLTQLS